MQGLGVFSGFWAEFIQAFSDSETPSDFRIRGHTPSGKGPSLSQAVPEFVPTLCIEPLRRFASPRLVPQFRRHPSL